MGKLIPNREDIGTPHIVCRPDDYTITATGEVVKKDQYGRAFDGTALAQAIRLHGFPGVIVETHGDQHEGLDLNATNPNRTKSVIWKNGGDVRDVTIIGGEANRAARIGNVNFYDKVGDIRIENVTLLNSGPSFCPVLMRSNSLGGFFRLYDIDFLPRDINKWNGKGMKWNIRSHGVARWDLRSLNFHKAIEHGAYIDNHQGDSYVENCKGSEMGRTLLQFTNRKTSGPEAFGDLVIARCVARDILGDGGSDFTVAGNGEGTVWFLSNKSYGAKTGSQGALVHYGDEAHGIYETKNGFASKRVIMYNFQCDHPNANRDHVALTGAEENIIINPMIKGNRTAIALDTRFGGPIENDKVGLFFSKKSRPSQATGWQAARKVVKDGVTLDDEAVDAMYYNPFK